MVYSRNLYQSLLLNAGDIHPTSWNLGGEGGCTFICFRSENSSLYGGGGRVGGGTYLMHNPHTLKNHPTLKRVKEIYENSGKKQQVQQQQQRGHFFSSNLLVFFFLYR
jgi:hypothetical protein